MADIDQNRVGRSVQNSVDSIDVKCMQNSRNNSARKASQFAKKDYSIKKQQYKQ